MRLSERLESIAALVPQSAIVADIGGDRGQLSYALLERKIAPRVILTDLSPKALRGARAFFASSPFAARISYRCGPGLSVLAPGEVHCAVLAGMGGGTIRDILSAAGPVLASLETLVLQPMRDVDQVRRTVAALGWRIEDETLLRENGIFYTVIRAKPGPMTLTWEEAMLGPVLLAKKERPLKAYLAEQIARKEGISRRLAAENRGEERRRRLDGEIRRLKEVALWLD